MPALSWTARRATGASTRPTPRASRRCGRSLTPSGTKPWRPSRTSPTKPPRGVMATPAEATSVRKEVVVNAPVERAFAVFIEQMDRIKPREHNMLGVDIAETVFEQRAGGRIYDRGTDGSECEGATVLAYEPPDRVVFSWNISPYWQGRAGPPK